MFGQGFIQFHPRGVQPTDQRVPAGWPEVKTDTVSGCQDQHAQRGNFRGVDRWDRGFLGHAQKAGIPLETIRAIHQRQGAENFSSEDAQIISFVREILQAHRVSETTFQALFARLDVRGLVELTATVGYYAMLACTLNAFDVASVNPPDDLKI